MNPAGASGTGEDHGDQPGASGTGQRLLLRIGPVCAGPGRPVVMAVINRTDDSFYVSAASTKAAVAQARAAAAAGAGIIDIGGVRAGRGPEITPAAEIERVVPVIAAVAEACPEVLISVDTWRAEVAQAAIEAGAGLINDTWAGHDPALAHVAGAAGAGLVCSHTGGLSPRTDAHRSRYGITRSAVREAVIDGLARLRTAALEAGVPDERILLDPTPDFGKNTLHSLEVMRGLDALCAGAAGPNAVLLAASRKDFLGETTGISDPAGRLPATLAATALAIADGVSVIRTHDVAATRQVIDVTAAIRFDATPRRAVRGLV